jgi:hypothetical protein
MVLCSQAGEHAMGIVVIRCPRKDRLVGTAVEMDAAAFERLGQRVFRVRCTVCDSEHVWSRATAELVDDPLILVAEDLQCRG